MADSGPDHRPPSTRERIVRQLAPYMALGWQMAVTICLLGGIGWWVDSRFDSSPLGMLVGLLAGAGIGLIQFLRTIGQLSKRPPEHQ